MTNLRTRIQEILKIYFISGHIEEVASKIAALFDTEGKIEPLMRTTVPTTVAEEEILRKLNEVIRKVNRL